ncbi:MAG TPA: NADP-dependent oxidoreductase [Candidatus Eremiobacteraceae bacterium]|nr:NADP-dependent oxidoreductase [Candidatus Eremiobacteraceae bacterium]
MPAVSSREIRLAARPKGWPSLDDFAMAAVEVPAPPDGWVQVRNLCMSVDPYMRGRMDEGKSYVPPFELGEPLEGAAVGEIVESRAAGLAAGDIVTSMFGWREYFAAPADTVRKVDPSVRPLSAYLGVLGVTGFTAWVGLQLFEIATGERVFISAAAGAVGSVAGQLAKLRGCFVVGSVGSPRKVAFALEELGYDAAFNYKDGDIRRQLARAAPDGIDVYFDNVGGEHLEAALSALRVNGRIIACGAISAYNASEPPPGPRNLGLVIGKRLSIKGFIVTDWSRRMPEFVAETGRYLREGKLKAEETVVDGIENAPRAFLDLLNGENIGKMVVKLSGVS